MIYPLRDPRPAPALKICGITDVEQALVIARMGVQAIGVIGVPQTPRYLEPPQRRALFQKLEEQHPALHRVWVVADPDDAALEEALNGAGQPTVVQLHGKESSARCQTLKQRYPRQQWWKALRVREADDLQQLEHYAPHVDALLLAACRGSSGRSYCVGGHGEKTNKEVVEAICNQLDQQQPHSAPHTKLITQVTDRPGHDRRYAIDPTRITEELDWQPRHNLEEGLAATVAWYLKHQNWCAKVLDQANYDGGRLGLNTPQ